MLHYLYCCRPRGSWRHATQEDGADEPARARHALDKTKELYNHVIKMFRNPGYVERLAQLERGEVKLGWSYDCSHVTQHHKKRQTDLAYLVSV